MVGVGSVRSWLCAGAVEGGVDGPERAYNCPKRAHLANVRQRSIPRRLHQRPVLGEGEERLLLSYQQPLQHRRQLPQAKAIEEPVSLALALGP